MKPTIRTVANRPAYILNNDSVELAMTRDGAHMAPVNFYRNTASPVQPYHVSAWQYEKTTPCGNRVEELLRGDFFCMPFGGGSYRGVKYIQHGETSCMPWNFESLGRTGDATTMTLSMKVGTPRGRVTKSVTLVDGQNVVYSQHLLEGFSGKFPLGHHATLAMPDEEGTVKIATSPKALGMTYPVAPGNPAEGAYYSLAVGRTFKDLSRVPTIFASPAFADASAYPRWRGYCDILGMFSRPAATPAWTAATFTKQNFVWFSLKDPAVLPALIFWSENRGRHMSPWNGRNNCLGVEDMVGLLATGIGASAAPNIVSKMGIPTCATLTPKRPTAVNYIQGLTKVPAGFDRVKSLDFGKNCVTLTGTSGKKVTVPVNHRFVWSGTF